MGHWEKRQPVHKVVAIFFERRGILKGRWHHIQSQHWLDFPGAVSCCHAPWRTSRKVHHSEGCLVPNTQLEVDPRDNKPLVTGLLVVPRHPELLTPPASASFCIFSWGWTFFLKSQGSHALAFHLAFLGRAAAVETE